MFVHERACFIRVALETNRVLRRSRPQLPVQESAVRIVAVAAQHKPFVHPVMKRSVELLLCFLMASVAKLRRFFLHQVLLLFGMVRRMAISAAHVVLQVCRTRKVAVLFTVSVAREAAFADFLCRGILERKYF